MEPELPTTNACAIAPTVVLANALDSVFRSKLLQKKKHLTKLSDENNEGTKKTVEYLPIDTWCTVTGEASWMGQVKIHILLCC